jgi:hypothetical protein
MAGEPTTPSAGAPAGPSSSSTGDAPAAAPAAAAPPPGTAVEARAARRAAGRAAFLASTGDGEGGAPDAPAAPAPGSPPAADPAAPAKDAPAAPPIEQPAEEPLAATAEGEKKPPLDALQRQRKRQLDEVASERAKFDAERAQFQAEMTPLVEKVRTFEKQAARIKVDPVGAASSLGLSTPEEFDNAARLLHLHSKALKGDPSARDASARLMQDRAGQEALAETQQRLAQLERQLVERDTQAQVHSFLGEAAAAATDETPLVRALLAADLTEAHTQLAQVAAQMMDEDGGDRPDPADVVKELERIEYQRIKRRGIDPYAVLKTATAATTTNDPKTQTQPAGETQTAPRTLSSDLGTPTKPRPARLSKEQRKAETIRALETGDYARGG